MHQSSTVPTEVGTHAEARVRPFLNIAKLNPNHFNVEFNKRSIRAGNHSHERERSRNVL
jgi:hypothetical protein